MLGEYEKAIDAYKMAVACEPSEATAHLNLAATYRLLKRYDEAIDVYTRAIRFIPNHPELYSELGAVYTFQGKRREAVNAYKAAMRIKLTLLEMLHKMGRRQKAYGIPSRRHHVCFR